MDPSGRAPSGRTRRRLALDGREFVAILAACMGTAGLAVDLMLPAFADIRADLGLAADDPSVSWIVTGFYIGVAAGQLIYGPLSDRFGRKPMLLAGLALYACGAVLAALSSSLAVFVACRVLWGLGAAAPRCLAVAMVRDVFGDVRMARTMSLVMAIFVMVPIVAPGVGAVALGVLSWRTLSIIPIATSAGLALWSIRLPETHPPHLRRSVAPSVLLEACSIVVRNRQTVAFGLVLTAMFGIATTMVGSLELITSDVFGHRRMFPLLFGLNACTVAAGALVGARLVARLGTRGLMRLVAAYLVVVASSQALAALAFGGRPPMWLFFVLLAGVRPTISLLTPSSNTAAMAPMGRVAGMASAVLGAFSTAGGALLGSRVDAAFDGTVRPFAFGILALAAVVWVLVDVSARWSRGATDS